MTAIPLTNAGFESGNLTGWTVVAAGFVAATVDPFSSITPPEGTYAAFVNAAGASAILRQSYDLTSLFDPEDIDEGGTFGARAYLRHTTGADNDVAGLRIYFLDESDDPVGDTYHHERTQNSWAFARVMGPLPVGARTMVVELYGIRGGAGTTINAGFDSVSAEVVLGGDPFFDDVVLLLPLDGADAATSFVDASSYGRTVTTGGNTQVDDGAAVFDGNNDSLSLADSADFDLGSGPFTLEVWIYPNNAAGTRHVIGQRPSSGAYWALNITTSTGLFEFVAHNGTSTILIVDIASDGIPANTWGLVVVERDDAGKLRLYKGFLGDSTATMVDSDTSEVAVPSIAAALTIGTTEDLLNDYQGRLAGIRLTKAARYASDSGLAMPLTAWPLFGVGAIPNPQEIYPVKGQEAGGTPVTISGTLFTGATSVLFDGEAATNFVVVNDTTITCETPAGTAGLVDVVVVHANGNGTLVDGFEYVAAKPFRLSGHSTIFGNLGTVVNP